MFEISYEVSDEELKEYGAEDMNNFLACRDEEGLAAFAALVVNDESYTILKLSLVNGRDDAARQFLLRECLKEAKELELVFFDYISDTQDSIELEDAELTPSQLFSKTYIYDLKDQGTKGHGANEKEIRIMSLKAARQEGIIGERLYDYGDVSSEYSLAAVSGKELLSIVFAAKNSRDAETIEIRKLLLKRDEESLLSLLGRFIRNAALRYKWLRVMASGEDEIRFFDKYFEGIQVREERKYIQSAILTDEREAEQYLYMKAYRLAEEYKELQSGIEE